MELGIQVPSLAYAAKVNSRQLIFAVDIPYQLIKLWYYMVYCMRVLWRYYADAAEFCKFMCPRCISLTVTHFWP